MLTRPLSQTSRSLRQAQEPTRAVAPVKPYESLLPKPRGQYRHDSRRLLRSSSGVIDGSVLTAVGELVMFCVIAQIPSIVEAAKNGKSIRVKKGDFSAEVSSSEDYDIQLTRNYYIVIPFVLHSFEGLAFSIFRE